MRSSVILFLLLGMFYNAQSSYVAIAPKVFHPGWKYAVQLTVANLPDFGVRVSVTGNIFNGKKQSLGAGSITFDNGQSAMLEIQVGANIPRDPDNRYSLQLDGSGALSFSNSTSLQMAPLSRLAFIQTDRTAYTTGQLIRFRVMVVNEDLQPLHVPKNITIQNPMKSTLATFRCNGSKAVYENTYQLADFPDLGDWYIVVRSSEGNIDERIKIRVVQHVKTKFEVLAEATPDLLIKESSNQRFVTVSVTAREMNGKGLTGSVKVTVLGFNKIVDSQITDPSGQKDIEVDLNRELAAAKDRLTLLVEVKDSAGVTSSTRAVVHVQERPVRVYFDHRRTDRVYRTNMPLVAVLKITDARGQALPSQDLTNEVVLTLEDRGNQSNTLTRRVTLTPGQTDDIWNLTRINSTSSELHLKASFVVDGRKYEANETIRKYMVLGNGTLNARWVGLAPNLTMGGMASFVVDVCNSTNFTAVTYMILSRGNIQEFGRATPGQRVNVKVTPQMCPKGRLVVYGLTEVAPSGGETPELIADSLYLTTEHCQGKRINPRLTSNSQEAGSNVAVSMDVEWTDPEKQQTVSVGHHDVYVMAVDRRVIDLQGDYDVTPVRVEAGLNRFMNNGTAQTEGGRRRRRRSLHMNPNLHHPPPTSTGGLLESMGLTLLGDVNMLKEESSTTAQTTPSENPEDNTQLLEMSERTNFPDTWLWKADRTDDRGKLTLHETLPDSVTSWVVTAFAVRRDTELVLTSDPLELNAIKKFYVRLNLPRSVRHGEKLEVRATVFNYDNINMDTSVTLESSANYIITGPPTQSLMVRRNEAGSVTFLVVADEVGNHTVQVTATGHRSSGVVTDNFQQHLVVKAAGVQRTKTFTLPVTLPDTKQPYDRNVSLDVSPWDSRDVMSASRHVVVMITGDLLGSVMEHQDQVVMVPRGCGEQNLISMVPSIHTLTYLTATSRLHLPAAHRARDNIRRGYTRQVQQYRWNSGGFSAFGTRDEAASTWLTALVLKSFAKARTYVPDAVDMDILNSAVLFLYTRHNAGTGQFFERGRVLQEEMQVGTGSREALSVFVTICLLEAKRCGVQIREDNLNRATDYVRDVSSGQAVRVNQFLAALTAYALVLHDPESYTTQNSLVRLIGYVEGTGAPWKTKGVTKDSQQPSVDHAEPSTRDVQITSYFLLTLNAASKFAKARDLLLWLVRNQNCRGGYRSTQDTMIAVQAISEHAVNFQKAAPYNDVVVTALSPLKNPRSVHIDTANAAMLRTVELPSDTSKVNVYVTGDANTLAVVKVVLTFNTAPDTAEKAFGYNNNNNHQKLNVATRTTMERPGIHNVQACINPESGLQYSSMVVLCLNLPSGFVAEDVQKTRTQNPVAVRVEQAGSKVHFYMYQPRKECINLKIQEKVKIDDLRSGSAQLLAYYMTDIRSEANIHIGCPDGSCSCTDGQCVSHAVTGKQLSHAVLLVCFASLFSLVFAS
ncbi:CD109 antigen-like [Babylonia areolata]|uniref:CD109 antigen-like n=1 Tax=Babylonia areolata TaxID=304850 RepID=UPI003FD0B18D